MAIKVFCCYAREDVALLSGLRAQLVPLQREGLIELWYDGEISAGTQWEIELHKQLDTAQVILLLISSHFIASDYCYSVEVKKAMQRHERGEACVIPIILSPVHWQQAPFGKLQALPKNAKPLTTWRNRSDAFFNVVDGIRESIKKLDISTQPGAFTSTIGSDIMVFQPEDPDAVDPDQVLKQAQRLIQEDPSPHGYGLAGMVLAAAGLHRKAVGYLRRSVQEDEDQPSTWFNLGQAYELIDETEKASEALIHALRLRKDFSKILKQREFEFNVKSDTSPKSIMFFAGQLKYEKLSAEYLLRWILRSILFQEAGEAFFENRSYWEVQIDED